MFDAQLRGISCVGSFYTYFNETILRTVDELTQKCTEPECCLCACMRCMQSPPPFARLPASKCIGASIRAFPSETCSNIGLANLPRIAKHMMEPAAARCTFIRPSEREENVCCNGALRYIPSHTFAMVAGNISH